MSFVVRLKTVDHRLDKLFSVVEGQKAHNYSGLFAKTAAPNPAQVMRIAQELLSLSTSLPLDLQSSILVKTVNICFGT